MKKNILLFMLLSANTIVVAMDKVLCASEEARKEIMKPKESRTTDEILIEMNKKLMAICANAANDGDEGMQYLHKIASKDLERIEQKKKKEQDSQ